MTFLKYLGFLAHPMSTGFIFSEPSALQRRRTVTLSLIFLTPRCFSKLTTYDLVASVVQASLINVEDVFELVCGQLFAQLLFRCCKNIRGGTFRLPMLPALMRFFPGFFSCAVFRFSGI